MSKNYEVTMTTNAMCHKRGEILEAINKANEEGSSFKAKVVMGGEKIGVGQFPVCIDTVNDDNRFAVVKDVKDGDKSLSDDEITEIAGCDYTIQIKQVLPDGKTITAELILNKAKAVVARSTKASPEIQALVDEKVNAGIISRDEADKKVDVMLKNYVDDGLMKQVITGWKCYDKPSCRLRCEYVDPYLEDYRKAGKQGLIALELRNAVNRFPVIMEGEKSVGKNVFVETIAWLMNMPLYLITFSRNMSPSSVYGEKSTDNSASEYFKTPEAKEAAEAELRLRDIDATIDTIKNSFLEKIMSTPEFSKNYEEYVAECARTFNIAALISADGGKTEVATKMLGENSAFTIAIKGLKEERKAVVEKIAELRTKSAMAQSVNIVIDASELYDWLSIGGLMVYNEMNMAEPNFFTSFTNQLTDGTGFLFIPGRGEVKISDDCVLCGTQNADYEGVEQQNEATMSRFGCISFAQPKTIKNQLVVATQTELDKRSYTQKIDVNNIKLIEKFYQTCQKAVNKGDFTNSVLNIRGFVRALSLVTSSDGNLSLYDAVEQHVINTCPVDERQPLKSTASTIFGGF